MKYCNNILVFIKMDFSYLELELELEKEHQEYEDLTAKYDLLEEDYLVIKAKLVMDKQNIERYSFSFSKSQIAQRQSFLYYFREYLSLKKEHDTVEGELRTLRETFNLRQDTWIKEKLDMQVIQTCGFHCCI